VANITGTDTKSKAGKKFTAYNTQIVSVKTRGSSFKSVPIRYSEFRKFNEQVKNKLKNLPAVPPKKKCLIKWTKKLLRNVKQFFNHT